MEIKGGGIGRVTSGWKYGKLGLGRGWDTIIIIDCIVFICCSKMSFIKCLGFRDIIFGFVI